MFWALHGLRERVGEPGAVLFTGTVALPGGAYYEWQEGRLAGDLLDGDWSESSPGLSALAHPVRLLLLREVLHGTQTSAQLSTHPRLGTSGQLYHHLRLLVSAGWLRSSASSAGRSATFRAPTGWPPPCACWRRRSYAG